VPVAADGDTVAVSVMLVPVVVDVLEVETIVVVAVDVDPPPAMLDTPELHPARIRYAAVMKRRIRRRGIDSIFTLACSV
jgi:hypothetical protein